MHLIYSVWIGVFKMQSSAFEKAREVASAVNEMDDMDPARNFAIEDEIVADGKASKRAPVFTSVDAHSRHLRKQP